MPPLLAVNLEGAIYQLQQKDPERPYDPRRIHDDERGLTVFQGNGQGPGVDSYWLVQGDRKFRVFVEHYGFSGPENKTVHLRIYDSTLKDETGMAVEGEAATALKALIVEGIDTLIRLRSPKAIETVDVKFGHWARPVEKAEPRPPPPFRMPWLDLGVFVVGLIIAAAWIGAQMHLF